MILSIIHLEAFILYTITTAADIIAVMRTRQTNTDVATTTIFVCSVLTCCIAVEVIIPIKE